MARRTYSVVVYRAFDVEPAEYVALVPALGMEERGRTARAVMRAIEEALVTGLTNLSREPDFDGYPRDRPKPRRVALDVVLPEVVKPRDIIGPPDNVRPFRPKGSR
jgi:hypothetical protein